MITEEEICHQNNNFLDLLHPSADALRTLGADAEGSGARGV